jgi:protein LTV1
VPDEIAGFQPDMDPRLREVLEALEDDAYVDERDEEDVFGALGRDGGNGELTLDEFEYDYGEDDEGWESDATEKAPNQPDSTRPSKEIEGQAKQLHLPEGQVPVAEAVSADNEFSIEAAEAAATAQQEQEGGADWLADFAKFKRDGNQKPVKPAPQAAASIIAGSAINDRAPTLYTLNGTPLRTKKRKGAQTNPSAYSMTSSSLARTDGQQLLDARFDKVEKLYALDEEGDDFDEEDGGMSLVSGMTGKSKMSSLSMVSGVSSFADEGAVRTDLDSMMDGFLGEWDRANPGGGAGYRGPGAKGKKQGKRGKNGNEKEGLRQLDEVRRELGPARMRGRTQKAG